MINNDLMPSVLALTLSGFTVPAQLHADRGEEISDELLDVLVEVGV